jgi:hypothetical protein
MIALKRLVEQQGSEGQYYDLGRDFSTFRRAIDGSFEQVKAAFEKSIGAKLIGKKIRARASRGYKQYVKDYEFNVSRITLDDYYDNYCVVAHDESSQKAREYFLNPGFKITILGPADSNRPQPQTPMTPAPQDAPMHTALAPKESPSHEEPMQEEKGNAYDAYSIEEIIKDIKPWFEQFLNDVRLGENNAMRDFVRGLGWKRSVNGKTVAMFDLRLPNQMAKVKLTPEIVTNALSKANQKGDGKTLFELKSLKYDEKTEETSLRVKKITTV